MRSCSAATLTQQVVALGFSLLVALGFRTEPAGQVNCVRLPLVVAFMLPQVAAMSCKHYMLMQAVCQETAGDVAS
jgi:hypothetical protein